jgi:hypothetical protein
MASLGVTARILELGTGWMRVLSRDYYLSMVITEAWGGATSRKVSGSIPSGVAGDFFRGYRRNHVPWGRLSF